jgi:hypothetical protein
LIRGISKLALLLTGIAICRSPAQQPPTIGLSMTTSDRIERPGWWPTKGEAARDLYAGSAACAECHAAIADLQEQTPMYHAATLASQSDILSKHDLLRFREAGFSYSLSRSPVGVEFTVNDGVKSDTATVEWAFGDGVVGQTYLLEKGGAYLEGRVSYFTSLSALNITIGHSANPPADVETALGHKLDGDATQHCFSCHTTAAVTANTFAPDKSIPGVHCEACHGPGAAHIAAMKSDQPERTSTKILNPAHLSASDSVDFCGACHRTWADVVMESPAGTGMMTVRFQPYRLENSRCWGKNGDARLTCIACHDPHKPLVRESSTYDSKCLACHSSGDKLHPGAFTAKTSCKVATTHCTSCHMPKYELPQTHAEFTDHYIRVIEGRAGQSPGARPALQ